MEITSIEPVAGSKKRYEVCLDGASSFLLYAGELRKYRLKAGEEIPAEVYHEIMQVLLPKRAIVFPCSLALLTTLVRIFPNSFSSRTDIILSLFRSVPTGW